MMTTLVRVIACSVMIVLAGAIPGAGQDEFPDIYEISSGNFFGVGSRGIGMGGAQIAAGMDGTALVYNPANLARIRRVEVLAGLSHERLSNKENQYPSNWVPDPVFDGASSSYTRLNSLNVTVPVPTYRGSAVVAFGVNRVSSFDQLFQYNVTSADGLEHDAGERHETGGLYMWTAGGAVDLSPRLSIGGALNLYHGSYDYTWHSRYENGQGVWTENDYTTGEYVGVSAKVGLVWSAAPRLALGTVVESPIGYEIEGDFTYDGFPNQYVYELRHPLSIGCGASYFYDRFQVALDLSYADWRQMEYTEYIDLILANRLIDDYYRETLRMNFGVEYLVPRMGAKLRAGYIRDPLPFADFLIKNDRDFFTLGAGFLIDRTMTFDIAFATGSYEYSEPMVGTGGQFFPEDATLKKYSVNKFYVTTAFRL